MIYFITHEVVYCLVVSRRQIRAIKAKQRDTLSRNKRMGKLGEDLYEISSILRGMEFERTGRGSDYKERSVNVFPWQKPKPWKKIDVKTGNATLSPLQKKHNAKVIRMDPTFGLGKYF